MDKSVSVADYCRSFCERVVKGTYGETLEDNRRFAGEQFVSLVIKIQEAGSKDDIKVPLRVLRDEIGRAFFAGAGHKKAENIESLFHLYDALESSCQNTLKSGRTGDQKENATAAQLLEELRVRFVRLAVGETWDKFPELKFLALKRMYKYMVKEQEALRMKGKLALGGAGGSGSGRFNAKFMRTLSLQPSGSSGATWQAALEDLVKAPSNKLFPFVKLLLAENSLLQRPPATAEPNGVQATDSIGSASKDPGAVGRATSDFSLDDLLGLGPDPAPVEGSAPATPYSDPFQPSPRKAGITDRAAQPTHAPAFEASFPVESQDEHAGAPQHAQQQLPQPQASQAQQRPGANNPFGASAFGAPAFAAPARNASSGAAPALPATPAPSLAAGASAEAATFPRTLLSPGPPARSTSGIPPSPTHRPPSVGRRTTSSEAEAPLPTPAGAKTLASPAAAVTDAFDSQAFETSFPPVPESIPQSFAGSPATASFMKAPSGPARQLSGASSMAGSLAGMGSGQLGRSSSNANVPPQRAVSGGMQPDPSEGHLVPASSDTGSAAVGVPQPPVQPAATPTPAPIPAGSSSTASASDGAPAGQPGQLQRAGPGSGSSNSGSQSFTPKSAAGFEQSAFPGTPSASTADPSALGSGAKGGSGGGPNPFGLPSPSFASPVPVTADNRFADVSPMADAPPPSVPAPMRAPPAPPSGGSSGRSYSAW